MQIASRFGAAIHRASTSLEAMAGRHQRAIEPRAKDPFAGVLPWELNSRDALEVPACDAEFGSLLLEYAGVALINGAIPRAGGGNRSDRPRPILYFVYARSWYRDVHNWPEESLFAAPTLREVADVWENTEVW